MMNKKIKNITLLLLAATSLFAFKTATQEETFNVLKDKSKVQWIGRKTGGMHEGVVAIKSGSLTLDGDVITSGTIVVDMTTVRATDTESKKLANHIKSEDFFNVSAYPESKIVITGSKVLGTDSLGITKLEVTGNMTILDKTNPITFIARNTGKSDLSRIYRANLTIDRTKYGITYKSSALGNAYIKDNFELKVKIAAKK
ncbi:MAG: YceI family protein [Bacteroidia bacterium]|nr:YceI family protein [Bacteroidia bacterium]